MKLDFGSGHNPAPGYKLCDVTGLPQLDYYFVPDTYNIVDPDRGDPVPDGSFNEIRCRNVVHHVPDLEKLFAEFDRVLQNTGQVRIIEPAVEYYPVNVLEDCLWYRFIMPRPEVWFSRTYRNFTPLLEKRFRVSRGRERGMDVFICRKRGEYGADC